MGPAAPGGGPLMGFLHDWRTKRRREDERKVLNALGMLRPSRASAWPISRLALMNMNQAFVVLARLEGRGTVTSEWVEGPHPRRHVYRVAKAEVRS